MVLDNLPSLSSPHRRNQTPFSSLSPSFRKPPQARDELGTWAALLQRHRFLLSMLALLAFLCTVYLYFAVTLGQTDSCSSLEGSEKALCRAKATVSHIGKLKFF